MCKKNILHHNVLLHLCKKPHTDTTLIIYLCLPLHWATKPGYKPGR